MRRFLCTYLVVTALVLFPGLASGADPEEGPIRFRPVHVYVDPAGTPLAAYQIEIVADGNAKIVGVEGGAHGAFAEPPYYDPAALAGERVIIAAFDTGGDLPSQRTRVATLHVREAGPIEPTYDATLQIAGGADGRPIDASLELVPDEGDAP
jgi:hypothetical protein